MRNAAGVTCFCTDEYLFSFMAGSYVLLLVWPTIARKLVVPLMKLA